jgi:hypothetical protein
MDGWMDGWMKGRRGAIGQDLQMSSKLHNCCFVERSNGDNRGMYWWKSRIVVFTTDLIYMADIYRSGMKIFILRALWPRSLPLIDMVDRACLTAKHTRLLQNYSDFHRDYYLVLNLGFPTKKFTQF